MNAGTGTAVARSGAGAIGSNAAASSPHHSSRTGVSGRARRTAATSSLPRRTASATISTTTGKAASARSAGASDRSPGSPLTSFHGPGMCVVTSLNLIELPSESTASTAAVPASARTAMPRTSHSEPSSRSSSGQP